MRAVATKSKTVWEPAVPRRLIGDEKRLVIMNEHTYLKVQISCISFWQMCVYVYIVHFVFTLQPTILSCGQNNRRRIDRHMEKCAGQREDIPIRLRQLYRVKMVCLFSIAFCILHCRSFACRLIKHRGIAHRAREKFILLYYMNWALADCCSSSNSSRRQSTQSSHLDECVFCVHAFFSSSLFRTRSLESSSNSLRARVSHAKLITCEPMCVCCSEAYMQLHNINQAIIIEHNSISSW